MEIIDAHVHIGLQSFFKIPPNSERLKMHGFQYQFWNKPEPLLKAMDSLGISKAVIFPFPFQEIDIGKANNYILSCVKLFRGRFLPIGLIHPDIAYEEKNSEFLGYKQHCVYQDYSTEELAETYQLMARRGQVLCIHLPFENKVSYIQKILNVVPALKIVVAHMGRKWPGSSAGAEEVLNGLKNCENIMFETSTIRDKSLIIKALHIVGEERICFGSDCPFGKEKSIQAIIHSELKHISLNNITSDVKDKILGKNIIQFLVH